MKGNGRCIEGIVAKALSHGSRGRKDVTRDMPRMLKLGFLGALLSVALAVGAGWSLGRLVSSERSLDPLVTHAALVKRLPRGQAVKVADLVAKPFDSVRYLGPYQDRVPADDPEHARINRFLEEHRYQSLDDGDHALIFVGEDGVHLTQATSQKLRFMPNRQARSLPRGHLPRQFEPMDMVPAAEAQFARFTYGGSEYLTLGRPSSLYATRELNDQPGGEWIPRSAIAASLRPGKAIRLADLAKSPFTRVYALYGDRLPGDSPEIQRINDFLTACNYLGGHERAGLVVVNGEHIHVTQFRDSDRLWLKPPAWVASRSLQVPAGFTGEDVVSGNDAVLYQVQDARIDYLVLGRFSSARR